LRSHDHPEHDEDSHGDHGKPALHTPQDG
jgi:hypothetical protein